MRARRHGTISRRGRYANARRRKHGGKFERRARRRVLFRGNTLGDARRRGTRRLGPARRQGLAIRTQAKVSRGGEAGEGEVRRWRRARRLSEDVVVVRRRMKAAPDRAGGRHLQAGSWRVAGRAHRAARAWSEFRRVFYSDGRQQHRAHKVGPPQNHTAGMVKQFTRKHVTYASGARGLDLRGRLDLQVTTLPRASRCAGKSDSARRCSSVV